MCAESAKLSRHNTILYSNYKLAIQTREVNKKTIKIITAGEFMHIQ